MAVCVLGSLFTLHTDMHLYTFLRQEMVETHTQEGWNERG